MSATGLVGVRRQACARWVRLSSSNGVLSRRLVAELSLLLEEDSEVPTVLTGTGTRFFSPGLDLKEVTSLSRGQMEDLMRAFLELCLRLYAYPGPTIAALNGDALGGGMLLASCCDYRIAVSTAQVGLTELNLALALPNTNQRILEQLLGYATTRRVIHEPRFYTAHEALVVHWIDEVADTAGLAEACDELSERLARQSRRVFRVGKAGLKEGLASQLWDRLDQDVEFFLDQWFSPGVQKRLTEIRKRLRLS